MTRRALLGLLIWGWRPPAHARSALENTRQTHQVYRADAVITVLSVPVYSRSGVGSGYAWFGSQESGELAMGFAGGSLPDRAMGLSRLGWLEERVAERNSAIHDAAYFGFMTASREESLQDARKALAGGASETVISAIEASMDQTMSRTRIARFRVDGAPGWSDLAVLRPKARRILGEDGAGARIVTSAGPAPPPFLYSVVRAMRAGRRQVETPFSYEGLLYQLSGSIAADPRVGLRLAERGLTSNSLRILHFEGRIAGRQARKSAAFRLWFDASNPSPLPLRIELQPKPFLRLIFEADPSLPEAGVPSLTD